jgi:predicted  nucleic acid-binding Zn-ribbon protein
MALTSFEERRIQAIETRINELQTAIGNLMSKQQYQQLLYLKQQEITALTERVASLETQIDALRNEIG